MKRFFKYSAVIAGLALAVVLWALFIRQPMGSVYREFVSPDGQHKVTVYRYPMLFSSIGGASDAPGRAELTNADGKVLQSVDLEMVQLLIDEPEWTEDEVRLIGPLPDWPLK
ncbi:hypothetical protein [uncultured Cohaesibacter sp.]|uniref:hypothetical protein n=1 Tax=uncultured Cohaesibacter sp. TaxID=1002546 RepID=UPI0029C915BE|nr:hypothetical protein [uncultured Cohaesibacter sp.]